jgi:hypothetical protein
VYEILQFSPDTLASRSHLLLGRCSRQLRNPMQVWKLFVYEQKVYSACKLKLFYMNPLNVINKEHL